MHSLPTVLPLLITTLTLSTAAAAAEDTKGPPATNHLTLSGYQPIAEKLIRAATETDFAYKRLAELCDAFGPRFSGSTNLEAAIDWVLARMKTDGLENVRGEEVWVPHWVRGAEAVEGVVVTVIDGNHEAVLINIVGDIKPEKIAEVGERLNIEPLKKIGQAIEKK